MSNQEVTTETTPRFGRIRTVVRSDLVRAYQCPCGAIIPPKHEFDHKVKCIHPSSNCGLHLVIPNPILAIIQTSRGVMVVDGIETQEEIAAAGPCPFPPAFPTEDERRRDIAADCHANGEPGY